MTEIRFEFVRAGAREKVPGAFEAALPLGISSVQELFQSLFERLSLPAYFGFNWDALSDCLRDLHWIESQTVVLDHSDLPGIEPGDLRLYLEVLAEAVSSWRIDDEHRLLVRFPSDSKERVLQVLARK